MLYDLLGGVIRRFPKSTSYILLGIIIPFFGPIHSEPKELILPAKEGRILEEFTYQLTWKGDWEIDLPVQGDWIPEGGDLPIAEILSIYHKETSQSDSTPSQEDQEFSAEVRIRFFAAGDYSLPISWRSSSQSDWITSSIIVSIQPNLSEEDDPEDPIPPILFGDFLYSRLLIVFLSIIGLGGAIYYGFRYFQNRPVDAIIEIEPIVPEKEKIEKKLRDFFGNEEFVAQKEFAFLITEYIKVLASEKWIKDTRSLTDEKILEEVYKRTSARKDDIEQFKNFLLSSKYQFNTSKISTHDADEMIQNWKRKLTL